MYASYGTGQRHIPWRQPLSRRAKRDQRRVEYDRGSTADHRRLESLLRPRRASLTYSASSSAPGLREGVDLGQYAHDHCCEGVRVRRGEDHSDGARPERLVGRAQLRRQRCCGLYGAIATALDTRCQGRAAGISSGYADLASAESRALRECESLRSSGMPGCRVNQRFGSAYSGNQQCAALAYGERIDGSCRFRGGYGSTESAAQSDALSKCRSGGFSCSIEPSNRGGLMSRCAQ